MSDKVLREVLDELAAGNVVPCLGPGVLEDTRDPRSGRPMPGEGQALMDLASGGQPVPAKVAFECSRALMHFELKRGRSFINKTLTAAYDVACEGGRVHEWLTELGVPYVIDTNRDRRLQDLWTGRPHTLVVGVARIIGNDFRFRLWESDGERYREVNSSDVDPSLPVLFKPLGTPIPEPIFVASDADYVDYITELMGGLAVPKFLKQRRVGMKYLMLGLRFVRDTQRMIVSDLMADAASPAGWAMISDPTAKERRFCASKDIEILECEIDELLAAGATRC